MGMRSIENSAVTNQNLQLGLVLLAAGLACVNEDSGPVLQDRDAGSDMQGSGGVAGAMGGIGGNNAGVGGGQPDPSVVRRLVIVSNVFGWLEESFMPGFPGTAPDPDSAWQRSLVDDNIVWSRTLTPLSDLREQKKAGTGYLLPTAGIRWARTRTDSPPSRPSPPAAGHGACQPRYFEFSRPDASET